MVAPQAWRWSLVAVVMGCATEAKPGLDRSRHASEWLVGNGGEWDGNSGSLGNWSMNGPLLGWDANGMDFDPNLGDFDPNGGAWVYDPNTAFFIPGTGQFVGNVGDFDPNLGDFDPNRGDFDPNAVVWNAATGQWIDAVSGWRWDPEARVFWDPTSRRYYDPATRRMYDPAAEAHDPVRAFGDAAHHVGMLTPYNTWGLQIDRSRTTRYERFVFGGAAQGRSQRLMVVDADAGGPREITGSETFPVVVYLASLPAPTPALRLTMEITRNADTLSARGDVTYDDYDLRFTREVDGDEPVSSPWLRHVSFWYPVAVTLDATRDLVRPTTSGVWFYTARNPDGLAAAPLWKGVQVVGLVLGTSVRSNGAVIATTDELAFTLAAAITNLVVVDDFNPNTEGKQAGAVSFTVDGQHFAASAFSFDGRNDLADQWGTPYAQLAHDPLVENRLTLGEVKGYFNPPVPVDPRCDEDCPCEQTSGGSSPEGGPPVHVIDFCTPDCDHPSCATDATCAADWPSPPCPPPTMFEPETIDDYHDATGAHARHIEILDGLNWQRRLAFRDRNASPLRAHLYTWYVARAEAVASWSYPLPYDYMDWINYVTAPTPDVPERPVLIVAVSPQDADACTTNRAKVLSECPAICGNGYIELGESCDDGNTSGGDGCPANCRKLPSAPAVDGEP